MDSVAEHGRGVRGSITPDAPEFWGVVAVEDGGLVPTVPWVTGAGDTLWWHPPSACPPEPSVLDGVISFFRRCFFLSTRGDGGGSLPALPGLDTASKDKGDSAKTAQWGTGGSRDTKVMRSRELIEATGSERATKSTGLGSVTWATRATGLTGVTRVTSPPEVLGTLGSSELAKVTDLTGITRTHRQGHRVH